MRQRPSRDATEFILCWLLLLGLWPAVGLEDTKESRLLNPDSGGTSEFTETEAACPGPSWVCTRWGPRVREETDSRHNSKLPPVDNHVLFEYSHRAEPSVSAFSSINLLSFLKFSYVPTVFSATRTHLRTVSPGIE